MTVASSLPSVTFVVPVRTKNPMNGQTGNSKMASIIRTNERARHRAAALLFTRVALRQASLTPCDLVPCVVKLTRVSAGRMDTDGLAASQKGVRDGISEALCVDDGSSAIMFVYDQRKGPAKRHSVEVLIVRAGQT
jgi:hypothetical protein